MLKPCICGHCQQPFPRDWLRFGTNNAFYEVSTGNYYCSSQCRIAFHDGKKKQHSEIDLRMLRQRGMLLHNIGQGNLWLIPTAVHVQGVSSAKILFMQMTNVSAIVSVTFLSYVLITFWERNSNIVNSCR